jgi:hypothetical protein
MIEFVIQEGKVRFIFNLEVVKSSEVKVNAQLLKISQLTQAAK